MFVLKHEEENELVFDYGGGSATLYYREPTTKEKIEYNNRLVSVSDAGLQNDVPSANLWGGKQVCTGLKEGDFGVPDGDNGAALPISSDPSSSNYRENWLELLEKYAVEFLAQLGSWAFRARGIKVRRPDGGGDDGGAEQTGKPEGRQIGGIQ